ncbi:MAG: glycoside hydrolase domain-containing protein [Lentisphaeria bacterium]
MPSTSPKHTVAPQPWPWPGLGNHRALVTVAAPADAVRAVIEWRRRDRQPATVGVRVFGLDDGAEIANVLPLKLSRVRGEIAFAAPRAGRYAIYYRPFEIRGTAFYMPQVTYRPAEYPQADPAWAARVRGASLPAVAADEIQARTAMDRCAPMELIAGEDEVAALLARCGDRPFLLFPEDGRQPIRMADNLPVHWTQAGPGTAFAGRARPNEYYTFQVGVLARQPLEKLTATWDALRNDDGAELPAAALTCFNLGGTDWLGRPFPKTLAVAAGRVQPLWFGVDLPATTPPGTYRSRLEIAAAGRPAQTVDVALTVAGPALADRGDGDLAGQARLRWLNSTVGLDDTPAAGYPALRVHGRAVACLGRRVDLGRTGLPERIRSYFTPSVDRLQRRPTELLARPMALAAATAAGPLAWKPAAFQLDQPTPGAAVATASATAGTWRLDTRLRMEPDGHLDCRLKLTTTAAGALTGLALEIPLRREVAVYMMGMGRKGGYRPAAWHYEWNRDRANHHCWLGTVNAGLHLKLKHDQDVWDLANLHASGFPDGWYNQGRGGCDLLEHGTDEVLLRASCGPRTLAAGESVSLRFSLIVTPLKRLDVKGHWRQRYHHIDCWDGRIPDLAEAKRASATVVNLHQGGRLNPYINYPFPFAAGIKAETEAAHAAGLKYKLYYTVRELSHMTRELWAFRSLDGEIYQERGTGLIADQFAEKKNPDDAPVAGGTGGPWLCEHLVDRFVPAWQQTLPDGEMDQAIATTGLSRLHNFYLEGLAWLIRELGTDGIYLDGVGYDREIMKRVRKTMDQARAGCLIDFHSGNNFHPNYGLNNVLSMYLELLPYVDSLWLGEGFDYSETPDYFMTEICGIPFGLMNDLLQGGGNPWRGMVYGMTCRYGWQQGGDPQHLWKLWKSFGIGAARMFGYWDPGCPVHTDHPQVLATAYVRRGKKTLVALASWAPEPVACRLAIDWETLGLAAGDTVLCAPFLPEFQPAAGFLPDAAIPVEPGRGWLLVVEPTPAAAAAFTTLEAGAARLLPSGSWRVEATAAVTNVGRGTIRGRLRLHPAPGAVCMAGAEPAFDLGPKTTVRLPVVLETAGPAGLRAEPAAPGVSGTEWRWQPPFLSVPAAAAAPAPAALPAWLAKHTAPLLLANGAQLRLGCAPGALLLVMEVPDSQRIRDDAAPWNGSAVELFLAAAADGPVGQLVFQAPVGDRPGRWHSFRTCVEQAAPPAGIAWEVTDLAGGWCLAAVIPLAAAGLAATGTPDLCRFECTVNGSRPPPAGGRCRAALAGAANAPLSAAAFLPLRPRQAERLMQGGDDAGPPF